MKEELDITLIVRHVFNDEYEGTHQYSDVTSALNFYTYLTARKDYSTRFRVNLYLSNKPITYEDLKILGLLIR